MTDGPSEGEALQATLRRHRLWEKKSPFEHKSLLKALSNALFLTRTQHDWLQRRLLAFFLANVKTFAREFRLPDFPSVQAFVRDFYLPEYQNCLLLLCAKMVKAPIELYHPENGDLRVETFGRFARAPLRIVRLYDGHYSALFPLESRLKFAVAQNIVLNLVERALAGPGAPFKLENRNNGQFENFEYQEWLEHSISHENFLLLEAAGSRSAGPRDFFDLAFGAPPPSKPNVANNLISSLQNRKARNSAQSSEASFKFDPECESLLAELERVARKKNVPPPVFHPEVPRDAVEDLGEVLFEASDAFSYRDIEELLWKDGHAAQEDLWNLAALTPGCPRTRSLTLSNHGTHGRLGGRGSEGCLLPNMIAAHDYEFFDPRLGNVRTVEEFDDSMGVDTGLGGSQLFFKKALKPSASEIFGGRPRGDPTHFSLGFLQPFPEAGESPTKPKASKKKKKGESRVYRGELKFFDEKNNFGFLLTNINGKLEDVFVYRSEFDQAGIEMSSVRLAKYGAQLTFEFNLAFYFGKYQRSKKALNLRLVDMKRPTPGEPGSAY